MESISDEDGGVILLCTEDFEPKDEDWLELDFESLGSADGEVRERELSPDDPMSGDGGTSRELEPDDSGREDAGIRVREGGGVGAVSCDNLLVLHMNYLIHH